MKIDVFAKIVFCLGVATLSSCQSSSNNSSGNTPANYQAAKMTLEQQEQSNPKGYLKVTGTYKKNLLGTWVIEGSVTSSATVAKFKDAVLKVSFLTKTNTLLDTKDFAQYEFVKPGQSVPFTIKIDGPRGAETIGLDIERATVAN